MRENLVLVFLVVHFVVADNDLVVEEGRRNYEDLKNKVAMAERRSSAPTYSGCWTTAFRRLDETCRHLSDEGQSRLALDFANCHLMSAGQKSYPCSRSKPISECLSGVDTIGFTSYTQFFGQTYNMCQFLRAQIWRQETENAIDGLTRTSSMVAHSLQESSQLQADIVRNQVETLDYQRKIAASGDILGRTVEQSKASVREMMRELRTSTDEQKTMIFSVFDRVSRLQSLLLSEVSWLYTLLFYSGCLLAVYLATATRRTSDARLWLFFALSTNFMAERWITSSTLGEESEQFLDPFELHNSPNEGSLQSLLHGRIWLARKITLAISLGILICAAMTFKDYNVINYSLLQDIRRQNLDLCKAVEIMKKMTSNRDMADSGDNLLTVSAATKGDADDEFSSDNDSVSSAATDRTWVAAKNGGETSDDELSYISEASELDDDHYEFATARNSNNVTPEVVADNNNVDENDDCSKSLDTVTIPDVLSVDSFDIPVAKKRGRPKGSRSSSRAGTPLRFSSPSHSYNLRLRHNRTLGDNPMLEEESPEQFLELVKRAESISQKKSAEFVKLVAGQLATNAKLDLLSDGE